MTSRKKEAQKITSRKRYNGRIIQRDRKEQEIMKAKIDNGKRETFSRSIRFYGLSPFLKVNKAKKYF